MPLHKRLLPFAALFVYIYVIYLAVPLFWDDFSYSSLSFVPSVANYEVTNTNGVNWTFSQMIDYLVILHQNWTGRILFHAAYLPLLRVIPLFQIVLSAATSIAFYQLWKLSGIKSTDKFAIFCVIGTAAMWFLLPFGCYSDQWFWYCSASLFVLPLPFFLGTLLLVRDLSKKRRLAAAVLCAFAAGFSTELISLTLCGALFLELVFKLKEETGFLNVKLIDKRLFAVFAAACIGTALCYFAPGNFARADTVTHDPLRLAQSFSILLFGNGAFLFTLFLCVFTVALTHYEFKGTVTEIIFLWSAATFVLSVMPWDYTGFTYTVFSINGWLYLIFFMIVCIRFLYRNNLKTDAFLLLSATLAGITPIFYNYDLFERMQIQIHLAVFLAALRFFSVCFNAEQGKTKQIKANKRKGEFSLANLKKAAAFSFAAVLCAATLYRGTDLMLGYFGNKPISDYNKSLFISEAERYKENGGVSEEPLVLHSFKNYKYCPLNPFAGYNVDYAHLYGFSPDTVIVTPFERPIAVPSAWAEYITQYQQLIDSNYGLLIPQSMRFRLCYYDDVGIDIETLPLTEKDKKEIDAMKRQIDKMSKG